MKKIIDASFSCQHIPQLALSPLYIRVLGRVYVGSTYTYHVPNIYLNMYLLDIAIDLICMEVYDGVYDRYMLGTCLGNIYL